MQREEERDTGSERDRKWCSGSFMHLDTIAIFYGYSRGQILFRADAARRYEQRARGRGMQVYNVFASADARAAQRYDNIFSRNRGYLRCTCLDVCGPRLP